MDRRALLARSGALALAAIAGCTDQTETTATDPGTTGTETATSATPSDDPLPEGQPGASDERLADLALGNAGFALDLHRQLVASGEDNLFVSPYSVSVALAMTFAGARGSTREAMAETLRYTLGEEIHPAFADLDSALESRATTTGQPAGNPVDEAREIDAFKLAVTNAVWAADNYQVATDFEETLSAHYDAGLRRAAFGTDPQGERERINAWVADRTNDRITDLLPGGSITANTVLVLTNAIYFLASWQFEFDPAETSEGTFTALDGSESTVPMMSQTDLETQYAAVDGHEVIELPYVGEEVSMVLILPAEGQFEQFERELTAEHLFGLFDALDRATGEITMPRFQFRSRAGLESVLSNLGMEAAFQPGADFSGMVASGDGPFIDDVFHETFVAVDEQGTEAAASTAVMMVDSMPAQSFDLTLDRPFLFCIRDRPTDAVLFLGRVADAGATTDPGPADG